MLNRRLVFLIGALVTVLGVWLVMRGPTPMPIERTREGESDLSGAAPVAPQADASPSVGAPPTRATAGAAPPAPPTPGPAASPTATAARRRSASRRNRRPTMSARSPVRTVTSTPRAGIRFKDAAAMRRFLHR